MLDSMVETARSEPLPEVDIAMLEARLRLRWVGQFAKEPRRQVNWRWLTGLAAALSVLAGGIAAQWHRAHLALVSAQIPSTVLISSNVLNINGDALLVGQDIVAEDQPISVVQRNVARWILAPHGRAKIIAQGRYLTVGLDMGRIDAEVVPSRQPESFAIETNARRVAVHGTRFSVELQPNGTEIQVLVGSVLVGSPGQPGRTTGTLITAPQRLRFPLVVQDRPGQLGDAADVFDNVAPRKPKISVSIPAAASATAPNPGADRPIDALPERPSRIEQEMALDVVRAAAARCFAQAKASDNGHDSNVSVRLETRLSVTIAPSGSLQNTSFSPPVPDEITECTRREIADWSTSRSQLGSSASRAIMLMR